MARKLAVKFLHLVAGIGALDNRQTLVVGERAGALGVAVGGALPVHLIEPVQGGYLVTTTNYQGELIIKIHDVQVAYAILVDLERQAIAPLGPANLQHDIYGSPIQPGVTHTTPPPVQPQPPANGNLMPDGSQRYVERGAGEMIYDRLLGQYRRRDPTPPIPLGNIRAPLGREPGFTAPEGLEEALVGYQSQRYGGDTASATPGFIADAPADDAPVLPPKRPPVDPRDELIAKMSAQLDSLTQKKTAAAQRMAHARKHKRPVKPKGPEASEPETGGA